MAKSGHDQLNTIALADNLLSVIIQWNMDFFLETTEDFKRSLGKNVDNCCNNIKNEGSDEICDSLKIAWKSKECRKGGN